MTRAPRTAYTVEEVAWHIGVVVGRMLTVVRCGGLADSRALRWIVRAWEHAHADVCIVSGAGKRCIDGAAKLGRGCEAGKRRRRSVLDVAFPRHQQWSRHNAEKLHVLTVRACNNYLEVVAPLPRVRRGVRGDG